MIQVWLSFNNGAEKLRLPVNPEQITFQMTHGFEDYASLQFGEITQIGKDMLQEISFQSFFPRDYMPTYCEYDGFPTPSSCVDMIRKWQTSGQPMRLMITETAINMAVTLRTFQVDMERGGEPGDIYYEASFKEYKFMQPKNVTEPKKEAGTPVSEKKVVAKAASARPNPLNKASTYITKSGDTLYKIAARADVYDKGDQWTKIYAANKTIIGANPNVIKIGIKLVIP